MKYIIKIIIFCFVFLLASFVFAMRTKDVNIPLVDNLRDNLFLNSGDKTTAIFYKDISAINKRAGVEDRLWLNKTEIDDIEILSANVITANEKAVIEIEELDTYNSKFLDKFRENLIKLYNLKILSVRNEYNILKLNIKKQDEIDELSKELGMESLDYRKKYKYTFVDGDVYHDVPFFEQAPWGGWYNQCQKNACEEASMLQAYIWITGKEFDDPYNIYGKDDMLRDYALREILSICDWQYENNDNHLYHDTGVDTMALIWDEYFNDTKSIIVDNPSIDDLKHGIDNGHLFLIPLNGPEILTSPPYINPDNIPIHSFLLIGYNDKTQEFIVNDPGTRRGNGVRYKYDILMNAIRDYHDGDKIKVTEIRRSVVELIE